jgi:manganese/zinc/iron transport system substrate-binding protein
MGKMGGLKKKLTIVLVSIAFILTGCAGNLSSKEESNNKIKILSTIAQIDDLVSEIGGDRVQSSVLVRGELNPHTYELVKGDDEKIQQADVVFYNGLGLEHGASVASMIASHPHAIAIGDSIQKRHPEKILWKGPIQDPHIWMDISLWQEAVDPIAEQLSMTDPAGSAVYLERAKALKEKMQSADDQIFEMLQKISPEKRYLVTSHDAFRYFARRYLAVSGELNWEQRFQAPEGLSPDAQLNPTDLQRIITHLHHYKIETLFPESNVSRDSIRKLLDAGNKMGLRLKICKDALYGDSFRGRYLDAMKHNAVSIAGALQDGDLK